MALKDDEGMGFNPLGWMFTFSDLVTLLLTFFVMLLSMKQPEIQKLKSVFGVFSSGSTGAVSLTDRTKVQDFQKLLDSLRQPTAKEMMSIQQELARKLDLPGAQDPQLPSTIQSGVNLKRDQRGLVITLGNDLLFASGSATPSPRAREAVAKIADMLRYSDQPISVEGHTDDLRPKGGDFKDNWLLSLNRALAVMDLLKAEGIKPNRLRVAALADTKPLVPNSNEKNRSKNRRTEIVLLLNGQK